MITRSNFIIAVLLAAVVVLAGYIVWQSLDEPQTVPVYTQPPVTNPVPATPSTTLPTAPAPTPAPATPTSTTNPLIEVSFPQANDTVTSPLTITGQARGNWYFEASFPIKLLDANGVTLGTTIGQATTDWMTTDFVPFTATLTYSLPTTATGTLILQKDNPSGEPANDASITIPVTF